jgi:hypothetical protein
VHSIKCIELRVASFGIFMLLYITFINNLIRYSYGMIAMIITMGPVTANFISPVWFVNTDFTLSILFSYFLLSIFLFIGFAKVFLHRILNDNCLNSRGHIAVVYLFIAVYLGLLVGFQGNLLRDALDNISGMLSYMLNLATIATTIYAYSIKSKKHVIFVVSLLLLLSLYSGSKGVVIYIFTSFIYYLYVIIKRPVLVSWGKVIFIALMFYLLLLITATIELKYAFIINRIIDQGVSSYMWFWYGQNYDISSSLASYLLLFGSVLLPDVDVDFSNYTLEVFTDLTGLTGYNLTPTIIGELSVNSFGTGVVGVFLSISSFLVLMKIFDTIIYRLTINKSTQLYYIIKFLLILSLSSNFLDVVKVILIGLIFAMYVNVKETVFKNDRRVLISN